jgi:hypothetical protein
MAGTGNYAALETCSSYKAGNQFIIYLGSGNGTFVATELESRIEAVRVSQFWNL